MSKRMSSLVVVFLSLLSSSAFARATGNVDPTEITFGSTFNSDPKTFRVTNITSTDTFTISLASTNGWLSGGPLSGTGPQTISLYADVKKVPNNGETAYASVVTKGVTSVVKVVAKCGTSSGCLGGASTNPTPPSPTPVPTASPSASPAASPSVAPTAAPTAAPVACMETTEAYRYTCAQVSLKLEAVYDKSNPFKWDPRNGCTATEASRRNADSQRLVCLRKVQNYLDTLGPDGKYVSEKIDNQVFYQLLGELAPYVFSLSLGDGQKGGSWSIDLNGFYGHSGYGAKRAQSAILTNDRLNRAALTIPTELRQFLDLRISGGKLVLGANDFSLPPKKPFNSTHSRSGMIQTNTPRSAPSQACLDAVTAAHSCHTQSAKFNCGLGPLPTCSTQALHKVAEGICAKDCGEACQNAALMRNFYATPDYDDPFTPEKDGWTQDEVCDWFTIADEHHMDWHHAFMNYAHPYSWAFIELADEDHNRDHMALTRYSAITKFQWSVNHQIKGAPQLTAPEYLDQWRAQRNFSSMRTPVSKSVNKQAASGVQIHTHN